MKINPSITANYFLKRGKNEDIPITLMKLLKLVFIAHGWVLAVLDDDQGVTDGEQVQAWKHGPVIPSLYNEFKRYHDAPILDWSESTIEESEDGVVLHQIFIEDAQVENRKKLIEIFEFVWEAYRDFSAWGLREVTHEKGSPWSQVYQPNSKGTVIENTVIKKFYKSYLNRMANNER